MAALDGESVIRVLNRLLLAEYASLIPRLGEATYFVSWASADEAQLLSQMVAEECEHVAWLTEAILDLRGAPAPRRFDTATANIHYCELHSLIPRILADRQRLIDVYQSAIPALGGLGKATQVAGRILARHREHLNKLQTMFSDPAR